MPRHRFVAVVSLSLPLATLHPLPNLPFNWPIASPTGHYVQFHFIRQAGPDGASVQMLDLGTKKLRPSPGSPWNVPPYASADDCAKILAKVAEAVGMQERVIGTTVRVYPTSSDGLWFRIQTPPGESPLVDAPTAGESSPAETI